MFERLKRAIIHRDVLEEDRADIASSGGDTSAYDAVLPKLDEIEGMNVPYDMSPEEFAQQFKPLCAEDAQICSSLKATEAL